MARICEVKAPRIVHPSPSVAGEQERAIRRMKSIYHGIESNKLERLGVSINSRGIKKYLQIPGAWLQAWVSSLYLHRTRLNCNIKESDCIYSKKKQIAACMLVHILDPFNNKRSGELMGQ